MRPPSLLLLLTLLVAGCAGAGSHPVRTASQKAALRAIETVCPIDRTNASGPHRAALRAIGSGRKSATRTIEPEYDGDLNLWKTVEVESHTTTTLYWKDASATKPAGSKIVTTTGEGSNYTDTYEETFTAGPLKGMHRVGTQTFFETGWTAHEVITYRDGSTEVSNENGDDDGNSSSTRETTDKDGFKFAATYTYRADRTSTRIVEIDAFKATFNANADGFTGAGSVVATDPRESATFEAVYNDEGQWLRTVTVHYADGTVETFGPEAIAHAT